MVASITALQLLVLPINRNAVMAQTQLSFLAQIDQLGNGLIRTDSQDFFEEGRSRFEQEVELLLQTDQLFPENLLEIAPELQQQTQENILQLEEPDILLREVDLNKPAIHCFSTQINC